ncbi:GNAT family N-acetyltransferase [Brevundimonas sp. NPDC092305]|uniref:GNAT family N-acetyltransferase n=1 Tax=Brevundimonas sp. NPDC092305 TaxID=3363957 RepID=UPI0038086453
MGLRGETAEHPLPGLSWRPMTSADLDGVVRVAALGFPDHFEDRACFENRLTLNPSGCSVLAGKAGVVGYLIAYPWRDGEIPPLNTWIEALPSDADRLYLHDLALDPAIRGGGHAATAIERLVGQARKDGWPAISLVAVNDAAPFWARHRFEVVESPALAARLASYGPDARYMVRPL